ncbi:MAG: uridine kinase [Syntrophaceae bacterium]|nr:uridine kinase [Syntrophaceae bacterium]
MKKNRSHLIGIAGTTCSGKSLLAKRLMEKLKHRNPVVLSTDSYYRDLSSISPEDREKRNFDEPGAVEFELLVNQLRMLSEGKEIHRPIYNFSTHTRESGSTLVRPSDLIIVEGLFVLHWSLLRELMGTKIFVNISHDSALQRRIARDVVERGRSKQSVLDQFEKFVKPMTEKFVLPTLTYADIVVNGENSMDEITRDIANRIISASR